MRIMRNGSKFEGILFSFISFLVILTIVFTTVFSVTPVFVDANTGIVSSDDGLNIRSGPGTDYDVIGFLNDGSKVTIVSTSNEWIKIKYGSITGYVYKDYVTVESNTSSNSTTTTSSKTGIVSTDVLNVRSGPGTTYGTLGTLYQGALVDISSSSNGWYKIKYGSGTGYVSSEYITLTEANSTTNTSTNSNSGNDFFGFPDSYKPYLRALQKAHPKWKFVPLYTNLFWTDVINEEMYPVDTNLVPSYWDYAYKSTDPAALSNGYYIEFDSGGYVAASRAAVEYYMDPRNFINENSIYQFASNKYDASTQTIAGVKSVIAGSFMSKPLPENTYASYAHIIMDAGKKNQVNPLTLASMLLVEQGYNGASGLISGDVYGYEGYYNFFNIGAYAAYGYSAVTNGLAYAKSMGWNTRAKSIIQGASFYARNYVLNNKTSIYLQKFNVMNGLSQVGTGQYMTAVYAANTEGIALKKGYEKIDSVTFEIPVYKNMPITPCPVPGTGTSSDIIDTSTSNNTQAVVSKPYAKEERIAGSNRHQTSIASANKLKTTLGVSKFKNIVIASGAGYADALSGSYLAMIKSAPIILVGAGDINSATKYIKNNLAKDGTVYILGGKNAVPKALESALGSINVKRLHGANRYETNIKILQECNVKAQEILVCSGKDFADALSASSIKKPILLVSDELTDSQKKYLKTLSTKNYYIIGGTGAVNDNISKQLSKFGKVKRIKGSNRYDTSNKVATTFFTGTRKNVVLVSGKNFPDGLSAGPLANKLNAPVLLVADGKYSYAKTFAKSAKCTKLYIVGGKSAVSTSVVEGVNS